MLASVQLRGAADVANLREVRTRRTRARPVAASANGRANFNVNAVQSAEQKGSGIIVPVGKYCESHYKTIRRPTRCASALGGQGRQPPFRRFRCQLHCMHPQLLRSDASLAATGLSGSGKCPSGASIPSPARP